jgi:hypothetical protein
MARNVTVYDLDNYPDNSKTVVVDHLTVTPVGGEGDEQWVLSFATTAYSDIANSTAIQDLYVREIKAGWIKSSGLVGVGGKFTIDATTKTLGIRMDNSSQVYYIELDEGANLGGDTIAADMETKIRAIPDSGWWQAADSGYELAYVNASVEFVNGKFRIISGSVSPYYTGASRSSVAVTASGADTAHYELGFSIPISSETIASTAVPEVLVSTNYTADTSPLAVAAGLSPVAGESFMITDGVTTDYFTAVTGTTDTSIVVATSAVNNIVGIANNYNTSSGTKVQKLVANDPAREPTAYYDTVDGITRWGIKSLTNQIDFSA